MKHQFHRSTYWLSIAIIIYFIYDMYKHIDLLFTQKTFEYVDLLSITKPVVAIAVIVLLIKYFKTVEVNGFFNSKVSNLWMWISTLLLIYGVICFIEIQILDVSSFEFAVCIFLSTLSLSFSKAFQEGGIIKGENDLTI